MTLSPKTVIGTQISAPGWLLNLTRSLLILLELISFRRELNAKKNISESMAILIIEAEYSIYASHHLVMLFLSYLPDYFAMDVHCAPVWQLLSEWKIVFFSHHELSIRFMLCRFK
jgi:hypothetical protein